MLHRYRETQSAAPDVIINFAGGPVIVIGLEAGSTEINISHMVMASVQLHGLLGAGKADLVEVYDLISAGHLQPSIEEVAAQQLSVI